MIAPSPVPPPRRLRVVRALPVFALALVLAVAFEPRSADAGKPRVTRDASRDAGAPERVDSLTVEERGDGTTVLHLGASGAPTFNVYRLAKPERLVVDLSHSERGEAVPQAPVDTWVVGRVTIDTIEDHGDRLARIVVDLKRDAGYVVQPSERGLTVTITPREVAPEAYFARKSAGQRRAEIESLRSKAEREAAQAEAKAAGAETRASSAEERADAAEARAKRAAAEAKAAKREAEQVRREAEQVRREAELRSKSAAAVEDKAKRRAALLEAEAEARGEARAAALEAEAEARAEARAAALEAEAKARVEALEAEAQDALGEARKLAEARAASAAAARELEDEVRAAASHQVEQLAAVEARAVAAELEAEAAEQRAATAQDQAVAAEAYATQLRAEVEGEARQSAQLLAEAEAAMDTARTEGRQAAAAHAEAKAALAEARKAARKLAKRRGDANEEARVELERAVAQAEAAATAAKQRERAAKQRYSELERDREQLAETLADKQGEVEALRSDLEARRSELATAREALAAAEARYSELGGETGPARSRDRRAHRRAKSTLGKARSLYAKLQDRAAQRRAQLETLSGELEQAGDRLDATLAASREREPLGDSWAAERAAAGATTVRDVRFVHGPKGAKVVVELDGPVVYDASNLTPNMTLLALRDAAIPEALERSLDTTSFRGPVDRITSFREGEDVKIVVASNSSEPATLELAGGNRLVWTFPRAAVAAPPEPRRQPAAAEPVGARSQLAAATAPGSADEGNQADGAESGPPARSEVVSLAGTKVSGFSTPPVFAARPGANLGRRSRWRGDRINIELQDTPIKDVLLLFSEIGRVNIIAGSDVQGTVTLKLSSVPWDQALDIILRSLELGMVQEGNVIRVATQANLEDERRKVIEEANAQVQLKPLETRLIALSYATVADMLPKVQSVLSSRGTVTPDSRTNTLIIMDVAENIALAESLVRQLDSQTPQVLIEARIVEARTNWLRQLGIQWGFDFVASPGTGNPTGLLFPNAIGIAGGSGSNQSPVNGLVLPGAAANPNYAVDLPAAVSTGTGGAIGFSFGSLSGNLNTNLRLSAAEDEGEVRIVSAPKVVTLDNAEARIEQGVQIPISQVSAQGVNTRYVNATLGLRVTPHVTNEGAVLLQVQVQKNEADFVNTGARGDPTILTQSAESQLLITDGDTAVIGGIYTRNQAVNRNKVPWFADIPIIGWFFKSKTERDDRSEMLIFLTPRIVNRSTSIGG